MKQLSLNVFLEACGAREALCLDVVEPGIDQPRRQLLQQPFALVGRHERADVCLPDPDVSRRHALVQVVAGRAYCLDLGSRTGTHWAGGKRRGWVPDGAAMSVGPYYLSVAPGCADNAAIPPDGWDPLARGSAGRYALPAMRLHILNHGTTVQRWLMNRVLAVIGSDETCKVRLRGPGVSRHHCALVDTPAGVWMIDLQRRGGIDVNGTLVCQALLEDGDQVQLGAFTIIVEDDERTTGPRTFATAATATVPPTATDLVPGVFTTGALRRLSGVGPTAHAPIQGPGGPVADAWSPELVAGLLRQFGEMQQQMFEQSLTMMFQMFRTMHTEQVGTLRVEMARLEELNRDLQSLVVERRRHESIAESTAPVARADTSSTPAATPVPEVGVAAAVSDAAPAPAIPAPQTTNPVGDDVHLWLCQRMEAIQEERNGLWERIVGMLGNRS